MPMDVEYGSLDFSVTQVGAYAARCYLRTAWGIGGCRVDGYVRSVAETEGALSAPGRLLAGGDRLGGKTARGAVAGGGEGPLRFLCP